MTVRYEANPPKIVPGTDADEATRAFAGRIKEVSKRCDAIHLTENVLGHERVSPIVAGKMIREEIPELPVTVSMRVRDKGAKEIDLFADRCVSAGFAGMLVLMGDPSRNGSPDSGQIPSAVVSRLRERIGSKIDLYLSISNKPDYSRIGAKIRAGPKGFMTQVVQDVGQVRDIVENLETFDVIPIVLYPSEKNLKSAEFLGLDLGSYRKGFESLVRGSQDIAGDVLITSPSDFEGVCGFLDTLR